MKDKEQLISEIYNINQETEYITRGFINDVFGNIHEVVISDYPLQPSLYFVYPYSSLADKFISSQLQNALNK